MMKKFDSSRASIGAYGEKIAANYLRLHGYTVKEKNYRVGHKELDIVAKRFSTIAFVEVKTRTYQSKEECALLPPPSLAVDAEKVRLTRAAAKSYLYEKYLTKCAPRMDVIEVCLLPSKRGKKPKILKIHHIPEAY